MSAYPPSASSWNAHVAPFMLPLAQLLVADNYPLLCNRYPYVVCHDGPVYVPLDHALINTIEVVMMDGALGQPSLNVLLEIDGGLVEWSCGRRANGTSFPMKKRSSERETDVSRGSSWTTQKRGKVKLPINVIVALVTISVFTGSNIFLVARLFYFRLSSSFRSSASVMR
ncbi:hypothetical protein NL676_022996 [Syzygium grande]|nr:hypothetical protein NL676_022996 [Syzygium grande]